MARLRTALLGRGDWAGIAFTILLVVVAINVARIRGSSSCMLVQSQFDAALARSDREIQGLRVVDASARCSAYVARRDLLSDVSRSTCWAGSRRGDAGAANTAVELDFYTRLAGRCEANGGQLGR